MENKCTASYPEIILPKLEFNLHTNDNISTKRGELPFILNGRTYTTPPESIPDNTLDYKYTERTSRSITTSTRRIKSSNIIGPDENTTLIYDNVTYTLQFIALHAPIAKLPIEISLFFKKGDKYFHILIPIEIIKDNSKVNTNKFLTSWLNGCDEELSNKITTNELFNFYEKGTEKVQFAIKQYNCIRINSDIEDSLEDKKVSKISPTVSYTICIFNNTLKIKEKTLKTFLKNEQTIIEIHKIINVLEPVFIKPSYKGPNNFNRRDIFTKYKETLNNIPASDISPTIYYNTSSSILGASQREKVGNRILGNVKCYPIDLASQIDEDGNIVINEENNTPIDVKELNPEKMDITDEELLDDEIKRKAEEKKEQIKKSKKILYWVMFAVFLFCGILIVGGITVYLFKAKSNSSALHSVASLNSATSIPEV